MGMTDPIADMLTRIRNAISTNCSNVEMPSSKMKIEIARILQNEGYIKSYEVIKGIGHDTLKITLKYGPNKEKAINGIKRISKPGLKIFARKDEIPKVLGGLGIAIISTSQGLMTDKQARKLGVGGEVICFVW